MAKVLFIEDSPDWQGILRKLLETAGHETHHATTFDSALSILSGKLSLDVIVFDLRLGDKDENDDPFLWLNALTQGMKTRKLNIPPIIIVTGVDVNKREIVRAFTEYRGIVFTFFEKRDFRKDAFLQSIKDATERSQMYNAKPKPLLSLLLYAIIMAVIVLAIFAVLLWSVQQIADPKTQQTILQVGGALIIVIAIFVAVLSQNSKLENIVEVIGKLFRS